MYLNMFRRGSSVVVSVVSALCLSQSMIGIHTMTSTEAFTAKSVASASSHKPMQQQPCIGSTTNWGLSSIPRPVGFPINNLQLQATTVSEDTTDVVAAGTAALTTNDSTSADAAADTITDTTTTINPRSTGLALQLDEGTRKSHSAAQNSAFVTGFFKGISTKSSYRQLLTSLYYVYKAMEEDVLDGEVLALNSDDEQTNDHRYASMIRLLDDPSIRRLKQVEKDMLYFYRGGEESEDDGFTRTSETISIDSIDIPPPTPATQRYIDRIRAISSSSSSKHSSDTDSDSDRKLYLFIAHQYTRYLGDLFGGQMMGKMATSSLDLPKVEGGSGEVCGVQFYTFDDITDTKQYITDWYNRLNSLDLSSEQKQDIVDEANKVFDLNIDLLQELEDGSPFRAIWSLTIKLITESVGQWKKDTTTGKYYYTFFPYQLLKKINSHSK
jgi:heme oxygenase (biliverdin-producing, ferredoxin)